MPLPSWMYRTVRGMTEMWMMPHEAGMWVRYASLPPDER